MLALPGRRRRQGPQPRPHPRPLGEAPPPLAERQPGEPRPGPRSAGQPGRVPGRRQPPRRRHRQRRGHGRRGERRHDRLATTRNRASSRSPSSAAKRVRGLVTEETGIECGHERQNGDDDSGLAHEGDDNPATTTGGPGQSDGERQPARTDGTGDDDDPVRDDDRRSGPGRDHDGDDGTANRARAATQAPLVRRRPPSRRPS